RRRQRIRWRRATRRMTAAAPRRTWSRASRGRPSASGSAGSSASRKRSVHRVGALRMMGRPDHADGSTGYFAAMASPAIPITGDPAADLLLTEEPLALLIGMLLDQQVPMEWAFKGPATLRE